MKALDAAGNSSIASNSVSVTTLAPANDTTAPTAPSLATSGTTSSSTNLSWNGASDNVGVTGYDVYQNSALIGSTSSTSYSVTGLTASTTYSFTVKAKDAAGNISASSNSVSVTTLSSSVTYCTASATNTADERIGNVKFGTINNSSTGTAGYEDFTNVTTNVTRGTSYQISVTPTWTSTKYKEAYAVYIDYNGNGVFTDSGEKVWTKSAATTSPATGTVRIPTTAKVGSTRMRVMMQYNAIPSSPCGTFTYGQVEDYTLNIVSANKEMDRVPTPSADMTIYPNPVKGNILNIENADSSDYRIFDMSGKLIGSGTISGQQINLNQLTKGVYIIQVGKTSKRFIKE